VNCYRLPEAVCHTCRRHRPCTFADSDKPICRGCAPRATVTCAHCGHDRPPSVRWSEGPVCDPCYITALRHRGRCQVCGEHRRLVTPPGPGATTCADCAAMPLIHTCGECGIEDKLHEKGRCDRCSLHRRTAELLSGGTGHVPAELTTVFDAICAARTPRSALNWLRQGRWSRRAGRGCHRPARRHPPCTGPHRPLDTQQSPPYPQSRPGARCQDCS
jgi:hypothetical protein